MSQSADEQATMPFLEHLAELRGCLARAIAAIVVCAVFSFLWAGELFSLLGAPLEAHFKNAELIGTGPAEAFIVKLKVSLGAGVLFASPFWFYQLWRFIAPGLHQNEKKFAIPFVFASTVCFLTGIAFCFFLIFPYAFDFFNDEFSSIGVSPQIRIGEYLSFAIKLLLVFGVVFELPILSFFLARLGLLSHHWLIKNGRYAIVVVFIAAAILTPPDVITQIFLALPLTILYLICIVIAYFFHPDKKKNSSAPPAVPS